jgi:sortase A
MKRFLGIVSIILGIFFLSLFSYLVWLRNSPTKLEIQRSPAQQEESKTEYAYDVQPLKLRIESIHTELNIIPASIVRGEWEVTDEGLSYLASSPIPGTVGNSVLYGHNWKNILGSLPYVKPGNEIIIEMSNGSELLFLVEKTQVVEPTNVSILAPTNEAQLTLYTCYGFLDSKRFVVVAKPKVSSIS